MAKPRVRRMADGSTAMVTNDGLVNMVAGLGTSRDKGALATYYFSQLSDHEIVAAYTSSALAARVVDMPAEDACREWREWSADGDDTGLIEAEESRLGLKFKTLEAQRIARLFGGAAIYIGDGSKTPDQPLRAEMITAGGLQYLEVLTPRQLSPGPLSDRLGGSGFGRPEYWQLNTMDQTGQRIHPSRLAIFYGTEPLRDYAVTSGWGFSVLQGGLTSIKRVEEVAGNINSLVYESKVDVFGIPDLMQNLATRGDAYSSEVIRRVTLAATAKGINGMLIRDAAETYEQKSASFGTLDTILDRFMHLCSADFGIPAQLLFSASIGGLGASGDIHTRGYYDRVRVHQTMRMGPAMALLDECLIRSALGVRPPEVHYEWRSLWQPTAKECAEVGKIIVDTFAALDAMDILPAEAISAAVVNALVEAGAAPGLEAAIEANEAETGESEGGEVEQEAETLKRTNDAVVTANDKSKKKPDGDDVKKGGSSSKGFDPSQTRGKNGQWVEEGLDDFDEAAGTLGGAKLITSQDYIDDDIVSRKIDEGDFDVFVSPEFEAGGERVRVVLDGHHSLAAAVKSGNKPKFTEYSTSDQDAIGMLEAGDVDGFLEAVHMGADYRNAVTGGDVW